jgi:hypothetical protein
MAASAYTRRIETVAVSQTAQALGVTGKTGDRIERLIITVTTAGANGVCYLIDNTGGSAITYALALNGTPAGTFVVDFGEEGLISTSGGWKVTTGSACTATAIGQFS